MEASDADGVPEQIDEVVNQFGIYIPPDFEDMSPDMQEIYTRMENGCCCTCGAVCGKTTFLVLGQPEGLEEPAVIMLFCGGACLTDMQVMGWIQETHANIAQTVEFRGGRGGN